MTAFHEELRAAFYHDVGFGPEAQREFQAARHRVFLERTLQRLCDCVGGLLALGLDEVAKGTVLAHFTDRVFCVGDHKQRRAQITRQLQAAFPASSFELQFEELQP